MIVGVRPDRAARRTSPTHEGAGTTNPSQPGQDRRAPRATNRTVAKPCHARWWNGSAPVSQLAKTTNSDSATGRRGEGTSADVRNAPTTLNPAGAHDTAT